MDVAGVRFSRDDVAFNISADAFRYLVIQQGAISDLANDWREWERAYAGAMWETYEGIAPFLPEKCSRVFDIGSGLGGVDVLLNRHYHGKLEVSPIDGEADEPVVNSHANTFNSEKVTRAFLNANGVQRISYYSPLALPSPLPVQLIVSFASWCFHYPPGHYLGFVRQSLRPGGTLIVDVRRSKPQWRAALEARFKYIGCAHHGKKFDRLVYVG